MSCNCQEKSSQYLIYPCSGCADVGAIADRAARYMTLAGHGKMHCLAGLGARIESFIDTAKNAPGIIAIDGCGVECARKTLEGAGITITRHYQLGEHGFPKGESPASDANIELAVSKMSGQCCP